MIRIGVIGFGYWGPNIVRNFTSVPGVRVAWVADVNKKVFKILHDTYPTIGTTTDYRDILKDPAVDAVVIATPTSTHFSLAKEALGAGKHVLVEKPMTQSTRESRALVTLAKKKKKILMVDHTFIYTPAVAKMKQTIASGKLGHISYIDCVWTNLGLVQKDVNVIYDVATHNFSVIDYLFGITPVSVSATGFQYQGTPQESVAYISARYPNNLFVHAHVSWLSPIKVRTMTIVGTKKMLLFDDMQPSEKVKIYDQSISVAKDPKSWYQLRVGYRIGSTVSPHIPLQEGLLGMAKAFVKAIQTGKRPPTDGSSGEKMVRIVEAATRSLRKNGKSVRL